MTQHGHTWYGNDAALVQEYTAWMRLEGNADSTIHNYRNQIIRLDRWLQEQQGEQRLGLMDVDGPTFVTWRASLTIADVTITTYVAYLRSFYSWAVKAGHLAENPALGVPLPRLPRRLPRPIADDRLEHAIDCAPPRIRPWLVLAGYVGLRCCEISVLRRRDVYDTSPQPFIHITGKGQHERQVALSDYVLAELEETLRTRRLWLFPRLDGSNGHVSRNRVSYLGNQHLHRCGVVETMHQLRHRFATAVYAVDRDLRLTQELLGHQDPSTTARYTAIGDTAASAAVAAIQPGRRLRAVRRRRKSS